MSSNLSKSAMFVFQDPIGKRQQLLEISGNTTVLDVKRTLSNKYGCSPSDVKIVVAGKPVKDEDNGSIFQEHTKKHGKGLACVHFCISKDNTTLCKKNLIKSLRWIRLPNAKQSKTVRTIYTTIVCCEAPTRR